MCYLTEGEERGAKCDQVWPPGRPPVLWGEPSLSQSHLSSHIIPAHLIYLHLSINFILSHDHREMHSLPVIGLRTSRPVRAAPSTPSPRSPPASVTASERGLGLLHLALKGPSLQPCRARRLITHHLPVGWCILGLFVSARAENKQRVRGPGEQNRLSWAGGPE